MGIAAGILGTIVVVENAPRVKSWWLGNALPALQSKWSTLTGSSEAESQVAALELTAPVEIEPAEFWKEISVALEDSRAGVSVTEAQKHFLAILMVAAFAAEQMRVLKNVRIEDEDKLVELKKAMDEGTN